ncbi:phosphopyruvate hydratase [Amycolatopsis rubida]|uniref:Enolase n=1 Tax=Amycolatopsis rubida TaxID=112413 RepID=A0ABX0BT02_9PSEU|nr:MULTISPECIES: phosphopyruvate hydratase [Amycolatopsis]MYW93773.1 phosphopyruvate hydratase [Amycolatopsis rubida]NEC58762.1 phosphopyruvate hydratase [Amycolatopsis rubida]OAP22955.1 Enolase [Amycolatopsis sp. M39]
MTNVRFTDLRACEILDSRGRPTLSVTAVHGSRSATATVPSGASTGRSEARERRDGDESRYGGAGVLGAADTVRTELRELLCSRSWPSLADLDAAMIALDGTDDRGRLGANAIVGVSMAAARMFAELQEVPLWSWLRVGDVEPRLPMPCFNVLNGGAHAHTGLDFQEFMIAPVAAATMADAVRAGAEVYAALRGLLAERGHSVGLGDEGGFAPEVTRPEDALHLLLRAIEDAGYPAGPDGIAIALDPAASQFRQPDGSYLLNGHRHSSTDLVQRYVQMVRDFPIWSIEDGLAEDDLSGWRELTAELGDRIQLVGDDNFVTNAARIARGAKLNVANAALIKLNQIGTVTETLDAVETCRQHGYAQMISHRSGETTDDFIADLAVGTGCGQLKAGAPARGERVAKYNRLLEIAAARPELPYGTTELSAARIG